MAENAVLDRDDVIDYAAGKMAGWLITNKYDKGVTALDIFRDAGIADKGMTRSKLYENLKNKFGVWVRKNYKVDDWNNQTAFAIRDIDPEKMIPLYFDNRPAETVKKQVEFNSFLPLFEPGKYTDEQGNEQTDPNWYGMGKDQIGQFAERLGYNLNTMKDRKAFYDKVREYGTSYEKAKAVSDYTKEHPLQVMFNAVGAPTAYKEQMKQALTDAPYDEGKVYGLSAMDALLNGGMIASGAYMPYWPAVGATALAETLRQGGSYASGNGFDASAPINAAITQATIPATVMGLTSLATRKATDQTMREASKNFRAGVMNAEDALKLEKNKIVEDLLRVRNEVRNRPSGTLADEGVINPGLSGENERFNELKRKLTALRFGDEILPPKREFNNAFVLNLPNKRHMVTIGQMLEQPEKGFYPITDEMAKNALLEALSNKSAQTVYRPLQSQFFNQGQNVVGRGPRVQKTPEQVELARAIRDLLVRGEFDVPPGDLLQTIESNADNLESSFANSFPIHSKYFKGDYTPIDESSKMYKFGSKLGPMLGGTEAASGISLQQLISSLMPGEKLSGVTKQKENAYTNLDWYRNLAKTRQGKALLEQLKKELEKRDAPEGEQ